MSTSISLLKAIHRTKHAGAVDSTFKSFGKAVKGAVSAGRHAGGGLAEGVGVNRAVGEIAGGAGVVGAGVYGADKANKKRKEWLYRHGFAG